MITIRLQRLTEMFLRGNKPHKVILEKIYGADIKDFILVSTELITNSIAFDQ